MTITSSTPSTLADIAAGIVGRNDTRKLTRRFACVYEWFGFIRGDPPLLHGITKVPRLIVFGVGNPLKANGLVVGGVGISSGHYTQDTEIATAGSEALEEDA